MRNITYKYKVGDRVRFKDHFGKSATCGLKDLVGQTARIMERRDYNGPAYRLEGKDGFFKEGCFAGLATSLKFEVCGFEDLGAGIDKGPTSNCDTEDSGESDDRAKYRELYLKALKKTYGKVPFETETVEVGSLLEFTEAVLETTKEV